MRTDVSENGCEDTTYQWVQRNMTGALRGKERSPAIPLYRTAQWHDKLTFIIILPPVALIHLGALPAGQALPAFLKT
jgi:hypothetical protein